MHWYLATLVFEIQITESSNAQFDIQHKLFQAHNKEEAVLKASLSGAEEETFFLSDYDKFVRWEFLGIQEIEKIEWADGITLKQETYELASEERASFIQFVQTKHQDMQPVLQAKKAVSYPMKYGADEDFSQKNLRPRSASDRLKR